mmetsp:Transcript_35505/g.110770  ORF Transcript_35505/g.110770 Transcript_35505/m.110770 type:complete len:320 (+) Transcript_35505:63-1022(+)
MAADVAWRLARGALALAVPVFPDTAPFGHRTLQEVALSLLATTSLCSAAGHFLTRSSVLLRLASRFHGELRDEAWEQVRLGPQDLQDDMQAPDEEADPKATVRKARKRTATELLFIAVHNSAVSFLAAAAWVVGSPTLALHAFTLEVGYEIFDTYTLRLRRLEPETLIHHIVSPICILCSTQTEVDYRVLCHLCICIDASGAVLGYSKFLLHYAHVSASRVYRRLMWVYGLLRVVLSLIDTAIIIRQEVVARGGLFVVTTVVDEEGKYLAFAKTDWTQLYFWAIAVLNAFNIYFFFVIRARARLPPHVVAGYEARMGCH